MRGRLRGSRARAGDAGVPLLPCGLGAGRSLDTPFSRLESMFLLK